MHRHRSSVLAVVALTAVALLSAGAASATTISYFLNQTNTQTTDPNALSYDPDNALPDGVNYLQVTFTDEGTAQAGDIDVTLTMLPFFEDPNVTDVNLGIQSFHFNDLNDALAEVDIVGLPAGWSASVPPPPLNADGFGRFEFKVSGTGMNRENPTLSFTIRVDGDSVDTYAVDGPGGFQGTFFFAAEVRGFQDQNSLAPADDPFDGIGDCYDTGGGNYTAACNFLTSSWFGGSTVVPEPSTALLLLGGLSGLAVRGRRRRAH